MMAHKNMCSQQLAIGSMHETQSTTMLVIALSRHELAETFIMLYSLDESGRLFNKCRHTPVGGTWSAYDDFMAAKQRTLF